MSVKGITTCLAVLVVLGALTSPASAAMIPPSLTSHPDAYDDGEIAWRGYTRYANDELTGKIRWAVFTAEDFPYDTDGWSPAPGELTYVYQLFNWGSDYLTSYSLPVPNGAHNIGAFQDAGGAVTGVLPSGFSTDVPGVVGWTFSPGIPQYGTSGGLVFSSPNVPETMDAIVVNGGKFVTDLPVPTPSSIPIPEPATLTLLIVGLMAVGFASFIRRRRTK